MPNLTLKCLELNPSSAQHNGPFNLSNQLKDSPAERILIVGHGANLTASLRTLLGYKEPLLRKDGGLANASLTILETHDFETFTLDTWNDTSYQ